LPGNMKYCSHDTHPPHRNVATTTSDSTELAKPRNTPSIFIMPQLGRVRRDRCVNAGITLAEGQCYGYRIPPLLGGEYTPENIYPTDIAQYYSLLADLKTCPVERR